MAVHSAACREHDRVSRVSRIRVRLYACVQCVYELHMCMRQLDLPVLGSEIELQYATRESHHLIKLPIHCELVCFLTFRSRERARYRDL